MKKIYKKKHLEETISFKREKKTALETNKNTNGERKSLKILPPQEWHLGESTYQSKSLNPQLATHQGLRDSFSLFYICIYLFAYSFI